MAMLLRVHLRSGGFQTLYPLTGVVTTQHRGPALSTMSHGKPIPPGAMEPLFTSCSCAGGAGPSGALRTGSSDQSPSTAGGASSAAAGSSGPGEQIGFRVRAGAQIWAREDEKDDRGHPFDSRIQKQAFTTPMAAPYGGPLQKFG